MGLLEFNIELYNEKFDNLFLYDCKCRHTNYSLEEIFHNRLSFTVCVQIKKRTHHKFFPVMLGSKYHYYRYPDAKDALNKSLGAFIINGEIKILANILINNISMFYVNKMQFLWNISPDIQIVYRNGKVCKTTQSKKNEHTNWRDFIPDPCKSHDETLYLKLFGEIKKYFPNIDHLSNKLILTAPVLLYKVLQYLLDDVTQTKISTKRDLLLNGNITFIFSKQPFSRQTQKITNQMAIEKQNSSIYIPLDGHKIARSKHFISITKRMIPQESMNSKPLQYPIDGNLFICMLSCKEMKDAGLSLNLARGVTTTREVDVEMETKRLCDFLKGESGLYTLVINCIIQSVKFNLSFNLYVKLKKEFPNISIFKYDTFIHILIIPNVPIVSYIDEGQHVYVTPNEYTKIFRNELSCKFKFEDHFCLLYEELSPYTRHSLPTKITVSLNNWKGSCYNIQDQQSTEFKAFLESPGYNTGLLSGGDYTNLAILQNKLIEFPKPNFVPPPRLYEENLNTDNGEIRLYVAFSNRSSCVEDGFIVDKEFTEQGPKMLVNVNFTIRLTSSSNQQLNSKQLQQMNIQYIPKNQLIDKTIFFGVLIVYDNNIKIQQSKRINVNCTQIDKQYIHTISHDVENPLKTDYEISSRQNFENFHILASYKYYVPIGKGTKLCNSYGQKSEISDVMDLGQYVGRRLRDGAYVKPQILMGSVSLIGRTPSGQVLDMLSSPDIALTQNGDVIAPQKFVVSSILSCTKIAPAPKRIDMLTGPNCFDGNQFSLTGNLLNRQKNKQVLKLPHALNLIEYKGTSIQFMSGVYDKFID